MAYALAAPMHAPASTLGAGGGAGCGAGWGAGCGVGSGCGAGWGAGAGFCGWGCCTTGWEDGVWHEDADCDEDAGGVCGCEDTGVLEAGLGEDEDVAELLLNELETARLDELLAGMLELLVAEALWDTLWLWLGVAALASVQAASHTVSSAIVRVTHRGAMVVFIIGKTSFWFF